MTATSRLEPDVLEPERELSALIARAPVDGAVVSFVGLMRPSGVGGEALDRLFLDHHPRLTAASLEDIASEALERFGVTNTHIVHRCGAVAPGAPIMFAAASARHRRAAFDAVDYLMDRLKTEALLWKREDGACGSTWIEPTTTDRTARQRWSEPWPE